MGNRSVFAVLCSMMLLGGCSRAPSVSVLGSFFPAWMICCLVGIALAVICYVIFLRTRFHPAIPIPVITYPSLAVLFTFCTWLIFYS